MTLLFYTVIDALAVILLYLQEKWYNGRIYGFTLNPFFCKKSDIFRVLSFILLVCVIIFRDSVGTDYDSYAQIYLDIVRNNLLDIEITWLSPGFRFICVLLGNIAPNNYYLMFGIFGFFSVYYLYKSIYKMSVSPYQSLYLFICFCLYYQFFNQFRQMLAIVITLYALSYLLEGKRILFSVYVLISAMLHSSSAVFFVLLFVGKRHLNYTALFIYVMVAVLGCLYFDSFMLLLKDQISYGAIYIGWAEYDTVYNTSVIINTFVRILILTICMLVYKETVTRANYTKYLYNAAWICTIIQIFTLQSYVFGRVTTYFFVPYIILLPEVLKTYENKFGKYGLFAKILFFISFAIYHYVYYMLGGATGGGYDEYNFIDL